MRMLSIISPIRKFAKVCVYACVFVRIRVRVCWYERVCACEREKGGGKKAEITCRDRDTTGESATVSKQDNETTRNVRVRSMCLACVYVSLATEIVKANDELTSICDLLRSIITPIVNRLVGKKAVLLFQAEHK
jgi:hypothetical protein